MNSHSRYMNCSEIENAIDEKIAKFWNDRAVYRQNIND